MPGSSEEVKAAFASLVLIGVLLLVSIGFFLGFPRVFLVFLRVSKGFACSESGDF